MACRMRKKPLLLFCEVVVYERESVKNSKCKGRRG